MVIKPLDSFRDQALPLWEVRWGSLRIVSRGRVHSIPALPGFAAVDEAGRLVGAVTYAVEGDECEVVTLDAEPQSQGTGTALLAAAVEAARDAGCRRAWLVTTNDNWRAFRFYQRRGWRLAALHRDAVTRSREHLKPEIPPLGLDAIPIHDELEFELPLGEAQRETSG